MKRQPVESSSLASVGYDSSAHTLEAEFRGGRVYQYFGVPEGLFGQLLQASSIGAFFNTNIRDRFRYRRV